MTFTEARDLLVAAGLRHQPAPAYLISGADVSQRRQLANVFVQALFCTRSSLEPPGERDVGPCGQCLGCRKVIDGYHPDLFFVHGEGVMGYLTIEQVRQLKAEIALAPFEASYRVYFIELRALREEAANAFLKTLEEPPQNAVIILSAQREQEFLPTILSRVVKIRLLSLERGIQHPEVIAKMSRLSWRQPAEIFRLAKEISAYSNEELRVYLDDMVIALRLVLRFKEGDVLASEVPPEVITLAEELNGRVDQLLDLLLDRRQDILRSRASSRLSLETFFISLTEPLSHPGKGRQLPSRRKHTDSL